MQGGANLNKVIYPELSYEIVRILFAVDAVDNELGYGYREKHYQKALEVILTNEGVKFAPQCPYKIIFQGQIIGRYFMDFVIERKVVLEIKVGEHFFKSNISQLFGYLKATNLKLGILANFTRTGVKYKRIVNINK